MKNYQVQQYKTEDFAIWNAFIEKAKNATFLFHRDFMEYHQDRFYDFSLLVFDDKKLVCVLPANRVEDIVNSHQGLTYGGFVLDENVKLPSFLEIVKSVMQFLNKNNIQTLQLKLLPSIYSSSFSDEIEYALFLTNAKLIRRDCLSVIDLDKTQDISKIRKRGIKKGIQNNLIVKEENDFNAFWNDILEPNLLDKHNAKPVHTISEIQVLKSKFPNKIKQFNVYYNERIIAGTTLFINKNVVHCQYISGNAETNDLGGIDFLFNDLITNKFKKYKFFDFGISNENNGLNINEGLLYWKESFGANTVTQSFYEVKTDNFKLLDSVLL